MSLGSQVIPRGNIVALDRPFGVDQEDDIFTGLPALMCHLEVFESIASSAAWYTSTRFFPGSSRSKKLENPFRQLVMEWSPTPPPST